MDLFLLSVTSQNSLFSICYTYAGDSAFVVIILKVFQTWYQGELKLAPVTNVLKKKAFGSLSIYLHY